MNVIGIMQKKQPGKMLPNIPCPSPAKNNKTCVGKYQYEIINIKTIFLVKDKTGGVLNTILLRNIIKKDANTHKMNKMAYICMFKGGVKFLCGFKCMNKSHRNIHIKILNKAQLK